MPSAMPTAAIAPHAMDRISSPRGSGSQRSTIRTANSTPTSGTRASSIPISDAPGPSVFRKYPTSAIRISTRTPTIQMDAVRPPRGAAAAGIWTGAGEAAAGVIGAAAACRGCASAEANSGGVSEGRGLAAPGSCVMRTA